MNIMITYRSVARITGNTPYVRGIYICWEELSAQGAWAILVAASCPSRLPWRYLACAAPLAAHTAFSPWQSQTSA